MNKIEETKYTHEKAVILTTSQWGENQHKNELPFFSFHVRKNKIICYHK